MKFKRFSIVSSLLLLAVYIAWWLWAQFMPGDQEEAKNLYSITYGIVAGFGGILGFIISTRWGGFRSYIGKALIFFSFGLLCQFLGQSSYSIQYMIDHIENSYPSYGEIFFFLSIPSYILGIYYVARASGSHLSLGSLHHKFISILVPALMMVASYYLFVKGNLFEDQPLLNNILTFVYPVGQATFVSLAIVAYYLSNTLLGGIMRTRILLIFASLVFQYLADTLFLYKTINGTWIHADESELLFALSYSAMTFAFIQFLVVVDKMRARASSKVESANVEASVLH